MTPFHKTLERSAAFAIVLLLLLAAYTLSCEQKCKQVAAYNISTSDLDDCIAFEKPHCLGTTLWVTSGSNNTCVGCAAPENISRYICSDGCTDDCPTKATADEHTPPGLDQCTIYQPTIPSMCCEGDPPGT